MFTRVWVICGRTDGSSQSEREGQRALNQAGTVAQRPCTSEAVRDVRPASKTDMLLSDSATLCVHLSTMTELQDTSIATPRQQLDVDGPQLSPSPSPPSLALRFAPFPRIPKRRLICRLYSLLLPVLALRRYTV